MPNFQASSAVAAVQRHSLRPPFGPAPAGAVSVAIGEPDFDTPDPIVSAAVEALRSGATHYVDQHGDPELRSALADTVSALATHTYQPDQILVTHGATAALAAAIFAIVDNGDKVVIPEPCYSLYSDLVRLAGGAPVFVPPADDLHWDLDALRAALPGAKLVVFSNPCNPTGVVHSRNELHALASALRATDTLVLSDEAYSAIVYQDDVFPSAVSLEELRPRTIYCQTLSKSYAMTGWRLGYLAGPADVIAAAGLVHRSFNGSVNAAVQRAALAAVQHGTKLAEPMLAAYRERRDVLFDRLAGIAELSAPVPEGTFYAFARYDLPIASTELAAGLRGAGVLVRPGAEFGPSGEGHLRLSFAADIPVLHKAMDRISEYLYTTGVTVE
ncbi:aminotransferase class I/II-fold pyridoxal phosphate-dependent enzyme [Streptomyces lincolnensis]|uniref:pyridoxal phosphate-dependent aminotransferase n=1 Tax=Streptomyces lincolnensis TaxID=1915 RepID=UPI001E5607AB|nr:aminotransferase class I/II-fold pyridoxal phosphate-dependent enzyme [Streptomyces lincolnensis]MCD7439476.1 aminotransferase class I/II-fold pyridoxal phosphate-dependent enzyme [Streptomyces lincolnensis]